jgi:hypothetical protein
MSGGGFPEVGNLTLYPDKIKIVLKEVLDFLGQDADRIYFGALAF